MGWDICSIGNHKLDTSNILTLAKQLSQIFQINIECVAFADYHYEEKVDLGKVVFSENAEWFSLWDDFYYARKISEKSDEEIEKMLSTGKISEWYLETIQNVRKGFVNYELLYEGDISKRNLYELCSIYIMKDFLSISIMEPFRWFSFIDNLKEPYPSDYFYQFRLKKSEFYKKIGASEVIYFPDQGTAQLILNQYENSYWEEIKAYCIEKKYYEENASRDFYDNKNKLEAIKDYEELDSKIVVNLSEVLKSNFVYGEKDYIDILYDDMSDIL